MARRRRNRRDDESEDEEEEGERKRLKFVDDEADVAGSDEDEEPEDADDDFIVPDGADLSDEDNYGQPTRGVPLVRPEGENEEDIDALERSIQERYSSYQYNAGDPDDEIVDVVDKLSLLPSIKDPKLWVVECAVGRAREVAALLMKKCMLKGSQLQIRSAVALDNLKGHVYVEAYKEAHVREACKGLRYINSRSKIILVPIKEMAGVLSVESKSIDLLRKKPARRRIRKCGLAIPKRTECHFASGDRVIVTSGDLRNMKGWVEKVDEDTVHFKPNSSGLPRTIAVNINSVSKYFESGDWVKVKSGAAEGTTGFVLSVEGNLLQIVSDASKEVLLVASQDATQLETPATVPKPSSRFFGANQTAQTFPVGRSKVGRGPVSPLIGTSIKVRMGPYKGYKGRIVDVKGTSVRVELESQMKIITIDRNWISETTNISTPYRDSHRYGSGCETPIHPATPSIWGTV